MWRAVRLASVTLTVIMGVSTVLLVIFTRQTITIFNDDPELMAIAVPAMRILLSSIIIVGPTIMFITTFQGLSKGTQAMVLSLVRQFIFFIPALFLLRRVMGLTGVWLSLPVSDVLSFIISGLWLYREYRIQKRSGLWDTPPVTEIDPKDRTSFI